MKNNIYVLYINVLFICSTVSVFDIFSLHKSENADNSQKYI